MLNMSPILTIYLEVVFDASNSCFLTHFLQKCESFELNKKTLKFWKIQFLIFFSPGKPPSKIPFKKNHFVVPLKKQIIANQLKYFYVIVGQKARAEY